MHGSVTTPSISIITICLNSASTIDRAIRSVVDQKQGKVEYIIIDGGSTDGTLDIIRSYGDQIDKIVSETDRGISDAFNKGISLATGEVIGLLNSDDSLLPGSIQKVREFYQCNPDGQIVHGDLLLYLDNKFVKRVFPAGRWWYPWRLVIFNHPATFVKKSVYEAHGMFNIDYAIAMDIEIFVRWQSSGVRIDYLPEPLVVMHYGGLSDRKPFDGYREARHAFIAHGFPVLPVNLLYATKCLLHHFGKLHANIWAILRTKFDDRL